MYLPNCQSNLVIALLALSLLSYNFINTTAYLWADTSRHLLLAVALHSSTVKGAYASYLLSKSSFKIFIRHRFRRFEKWRQLGIFRLRRAESAKEGFLRAGQKVGAEPNKHLRFAKVIVEVVFVFVGGHFG